MSFEFNYQQGGEEHGKYYPALKPTELAIRHQAEGRSIYYHYEPGNGTRYEVIFTEVQPAYEDEPIIVMTIVEPRRRSMVIPPYPFRMHSLDYMMEKLEMLEGDCYALIPLINFHLG